MSEQKVVMQIFLNEQGQVGVNGPIQDKIFCLGLLELAKTAILEHKADGPRIARAAGAEIVGLGRKMN